MLEDAIQDAEVDYDTPMQLALCAALEAGVAALQAALLTAS